MNEYNKDINTATEGENNATDGKNGGGGVNTPEQNKNAVAGKDNATAGVYVHTFKKPFEYEGKKYTTLNFYFEQLTGQDLIAVENEMQANAEYAIDPLLSRSLQSKLASRAGSIGSDILEAMPLQDFNRITSAARNFLMDSGY